LRFSVFRIPKPFLIEFITASSKGANRNERLVYVFIAGIFTVAAGAWYALAFVVRPSFG
jgi:hypothetical protein